MIRDLGHAGGEMREAARCNPARAVPGSRAWAWAGGWEADEAAGCVLREGVSLRERAREATRDAARRPTMPPYEALLDGRRHGSDFGAAAPVPAIGDTGCVAGPRVLFAPCRRAGRR